jgi:hypothetical protein
MPCWLRCAQLRLHLRRPLRQVRLPARRIQANQRHPVEPDARHAHPSTTFVGHGVGLARQHAVHTALIFFR